jgi:hypothetical protein
LELHPHLHRLAYYTATTRSTSSSSSFCYFFSALRRRIFIFFVASAAPDKFRKFSLLQRFSHFARPAFPATRCCSLDGLGARCCSLV